MIVWGGMEAVGTVYNDGSRYNPATDTWTPVASTGAPSRAPSHVAVWTGKEMVVWGGRFDTSGGRYDPVTDTWKPTSIASARPTLECQRRVDGQRDDRLGRRPGGFTLNSGGR